jgi:hypothetical protein
MLIEQVDDVGPEPLQRRFDNVADVFGLAVHAGLLAGLGIEPEAELGGDRDLFAKRRQRLADQRLVCEWSIDLRSVEEGHAALDGVADQLDILLLFEGAAVTRTDPHASKADRRHVEAAFSKLAHLHCCFSIL